MSADATKAERIAAMQEGLREMGALAYAALLPKVIAQWEREYGVDWFAVGPCICLGSLRTPDTSGRRCLKCGGDL